MKKKLLIAGAVAAVAAIAYKLSSGNKKTVSEHVDDLINKQANDAQDAMEVVKYDAEKTEYNLARQKYYSLASKYPPESWTIEQINEAVNNWGAIKSALVNYQNYMAKMGKSSEASTKAKQCYDISTAQQLETSAKSQYQLYTEKEAIYNKIVTICNQYKIVAADLGITNFADQSKTVLNNALTKANSLSTIKSKYDKLASICAKSSDDIAKYVGTGKWYNLTTASLDSAIALANTAYETWAKDTAKHLVFKAGRSLLGGKVPDLNNVDYKDPTSIDWTNGDGYHLRTYPNKYTLDQSEWQAIVNGCKDERVCAYFKQIFADCNFRYPNYTCQVDKYWEDVDSVYGVFTLNARGGQSHIQKRPNYYSIAENLDKNEPFKA